MNIASIPANSATTPTVAPVESVRADAKGQDRGGQPQPFAASTPRAAQPIAAQLGPATVRALFNEASRAGQPLVNPAQQVVTSPAPAIAPLAAGLVSALAAQKAGRGAPTEPERAGRAERKAARKTSDPAKTMGETLSPETVSALIQAVHRRRDPRDDAEGGLLI